MAAHSQEIPGLTARLDRLCYHHGGRSLPAETPHMFMYYVTIHNGSELLVTLLGRKWVIEHADGSRQVIEGDKIVGETPRLAPGDEYSYHSHMITASHARATGSYHGIDEFGRRIHVLLPPFEMQVPDESP